jgi:hypothetical protein
MKTRRIVPAIMAAALLLVLASPVLAEDEANYNFASAQGSKQLRAAPGQESEGVIYFYNIEGNRITHISLEVSKAPDNWKVEIDPPQHEIQVDVSGRIITVTENLYVEPSEALAEEPEEVPEGMVCIKIADLGYVLAKAVHISIQVPETAEIGTKGDIAIAAEASWLGQSGAAAIKQARRFDFFVEVTSGETEYRETIIGEVEKAEGETPQVMPAAEPEAVPVTEPATEEGGTSTNIFMRWLPAIIAAAVVVVAAILLVIINRRRGKTKG